MPTGHDDVLERLEVAVNAWNLEVAQMRGSLAGEIGKLARQLDLLREIPAASEPPQEDWQERTRELEALLQSARARLEQIEERARQEAVRAEEIASATSDDLSPRLADALRDRDEAHQEIVSLRAEADLLRRANAHLSVHVLRPEAVGGGAVAHSATLPGLEADGPDPVEICDANGRRRRLGEILLSVGAISAAQLDEALAEQSTPPHRRLGAILIENGVTREDIVARILARQLGIPYIELGGNVVDDAAPHAIRGDLARRRECVPVSISPGRLVLAMANPFDLTAIEDVELASGRRVDPAVATASDIKAALRRYYGLQEPGGGDVIALDGAGR